MKRKSKIIISITGIFLVLLILSGLTYAYFLTQIKGNTNTKSVSITSANLQLVYNDGNGTIIGNNIVPGTTLGEKTFSVTNTGNVSVSYGVYIEDVINEFERTSDITLTLTCESNKANTTCDGASTIFPENNRKIVTNDISSGETQTYRLVVEYIEAGVDQSVDMGKRLSGKVQIYGSERLTLEFNIANSRSGDYGIIESEPKTSYATIENGTGTYRFVGVPMGSHTLTIYDENDNIKGSSPITIGTGNSTSVENTNITVPETTEEISIPVNNISVGSMELGSVDLYEKNNPYKVGTLANAIIHNAQFVTEEEKALNYAEFRKTPITIPGQETNKLNYETYGTEASGNTNITITPAQQGYYWTYSTSYTIDKNTGNYSLVNPQKCRYTDNDCIRSLLVDNKNVYIAGREVPMFTNATDRFSYISAPSTNGIFRIIVAPEPNNEGNITLVTHQITNIPHSIENILSLAEDDYAKSYYYRGDVQNNYLNFASKCWRIVRIEGDGSIKLILEDKDQECSSSIDGNWSLGSGGFGTMNITQQGGNVKRYYDYSNSSNYLTTKSQIYKYYTFQNNLTENDYNKLKTENWCLGDLEHAYRGNNLLDNSISELMYSNSNFNYYTKVRLESLYLPTLKCNGNRINEFNNLGSYILESDMKVATLTADEVVFAGAKVNNNNNNNYLINKPGIFHTLSLYDNYFEFIVYASGLLGGQNVEVNARPSVVLIPDISITDGNGSLENPYEVE